MNYIKGTFRKFIFQSDKNYVIGLFKVSETDDYDLEDYVGKSITITGYFHELAIDEKYIMRGNLVDNPKYGFQYNVLEYERVKPEGKDGIIEFLSSDLFPKIGEKTATEIVNVLGENALDLIKDNYQNLLLVPKIKEATAKKVHDILVKYNESYDTIVYLSKIGFSIKDSMSIYNFYKDNTITILEDNIYDLIDTIDEITFSKIDDIRHNLEIPDDDENRIKAGIIYIMKALCFQNGDTYLKKEEIYNPTIKLLNVDIGFESFEYLLTILNKEGKIVIKNENIYLKENFLAENNISENVFYLTNKSDTKYKNIDKEIDSLEVYFDIKYNEKQKEAIKQAIEKNFSIITGGPGTGKTTIIKGIVELYKKINRLTYMDLTNQLVLLAPTGRAAKRMSEACMMPASTIHRFLKWNKEADKFMVNEMNKSDAKFVIIDEVSMIDVNLFDNLLKGLNKNVKIVMIGDYNQLESVGPGKVLKDFIDSEMINVIFLKDLYRQKENSYISYLAKDINENNLSEYFTEKRDDYTFIECDNSNLKLYIKEVVKKAIEKGYTSDDIQVLAPMYKGENGIDNLNKLLQEVFNRENNQEYIIYGDVIYRENDKVLQLENDPDNNVFNGDIGYIKRINKNDIYIDFDGNVVRYTKKDLNKIKHGYAISIHKSQGSEFKIVILPIVMQYKIMLYRKLIYTAVTRAKSNLTIVGSKDAFMYSVYNEGMYERRTSLKEDLISCINNN